MIKIKDYIFNENDIHHIGKKYTTKTKELYIYFNNGHESMIIEEATFDDIEWNYDKEIIRKALDNDIDLRIKIQELEEELEDIKGNYELVVTKCKKLEEDNEELIDKINKAIEYIKNIYNNKDYIDDLYMFDLLKILKGEE